MHPITTARTERATLRSRFEIAKEAEWREHSREADAKIAAAVYAARQAGHSISAIARWYGTSNRGTIYSILRGLAGTPVVLPPGTRFSAVPAPAPDAGPGRYLLTDQVAQSTVLVDAIQCRLIRNDGEAPDATKALWLWEVHGHPEHEAWAACPGAGTGVAAQGIPNSEEDTE